MYPLGSCGINFECLNFRIANKNEFLIISMVS